MQIITRTMISNNMFSYFILIDWIRHLYAYFIPNFRILASRLCQYKRKMYLPLKMPFPNLEYGPCRIEECVLPGGQSMESFYQNRKCWKKRQWNLWLSGTFHAWNLLARTQRNFPRFRWTVLAFTEDKMSSSKSTRNFLHGTFIVCHLIKSNINMHL